MLQRVTIHSLILNSVLNKEKKLEHTYLHIYIESCHALLRRTAYLITYQKIV